MIRIRINNTDLLLILHTYSVFRSSLASRGTFQPGPQWTWESPTPQETKHKPALNALIGVFFVLHGAAILGNLFCIFETLRPGGPTLGHPKFVIRCISTLLP
jgi:hypothetical protein